MLFRSQKRDKEVVCVPESLEGLLSDAVMSGGVHEKHTEQHYVSRDTSRLSVMDLECDLRPYLASLHVVKAARSQ